MRRIVLTAVYCSKVLAQEGHIIFTRITQHFIILCMGKYHKKGKAALFQNQLQ